MMAAAMTAAAAIALGGCTSAPTPTIDLPAQDRARWVMPLDEFASPAASELAAYATMLLVRECLAPSGVDLPVAWQPTDEAAYLVETANPSRFPVLTPEIAGEWGYRAPREPGLPDASRDEFLRVAMSTPGFDALYDGCLDEAEQSIPQRPREWSNHLTGLVNQAGATASADGAVTDADAQWKACLSEKGYASLPDSPLGEEWMPTTALQEQLGIVRYEGAADGSAENPLTAVEIELAVADAECRESVGWSEARYQAEWAAQAGLVAADADALARGAEEVRADVGAIQRVIVEHAPAQ